MQHSPGSIRVKKRHLAKLEWCLLIRQLHCTSIDIFMWKVVSYFYMNVINFRKYTSEYLEVMEHFCNLLSKCSETQCSGVCDAANIVQ